MTTYRIETPSAAQLTRSIALALGLAGAVLVGAVLPAEYGIDPTGLGRVLGLTKLHAAQVNGQAATGDSSRQSPTPAPKPVAGPVLMPPKDPSDPTRDIVGQPLKPMLGGVVHPQQDVFATDTQQLILAPGKGAELKTHLAKGQTLQFRWTTTAPVSFDLHGEPEGAKGGEYTSYAMAADRTSDAGELVAPFAGIHGWYWLNRSDRPVMLEVTASGFHIKLQPPPRH